ncbi:MAG: cell division ATP-binding protein FtsE [Chlorobiaceae bacterium]|nr:cell division ATP-binding protein FtsE [Chlorobiaceae bacterium]MBA4310978.1 cell division ATP-binding protein FtsE [Chlorobiaceae bacterium]
MLTFNNVSFGYDNKYLLREVDFSLKQGEFAFIIGKSGSGKSSLLQMIYLKNKPTDGYIEFDKFDTMTLKTKNLPELRKKIGIIFQEFRLLSDRTIFDNLAFILESTSTNKKEIKKKINNILAEVGLSHKKKNFPEELSGGEQQRVAIARAIVNDPLLILADEPTGNLDPETSGEILETIKKINARGTAVLFATHNYDLIKKVNARVLQIENGKVIDVTTSIK